MGAPVGWEFEGGRPASWKSPSGTTAETEEARKAAWGKGTALAMLDNQNNGLGMKPLATDVDCIAGFGNDKKWGRSTSLAELADGGNVFMVGDSLVNHLCQLGSPSLCNTKNVTEITVDLKAKGIGGDAPNYTSWKFQKDEWQHLLKARPGGYNKDYKRYGRSERGLCHVSRRTQPCSR